MKSRRTRKIKRGGVGLSDFTNFLTGKKTPEQQPEPGPDQVPMGAGTEPGADQAPMEQATMGPVPTDQSSGNSTVDQKVNEILGLTGYHMRAIINAISVCNSTMKMQNNASGVGNSVLNAFGRGNEAKLEMTQCGSQCIARSDTIKAALKTLLEVAGETPVLGFIASKTGTINSANYLKNSALSLGSRAIGTNATNQASALSNKASEAASSVGDYFSSFTRKATPASGGRRRKLTRRR